MDLPNFRHLDAVIGNQDLRELLGYVDSADVPDEVRLILDRADATPEADHNVAPPGDDVNRRGFTRDDSGAGGLDRDAAAPGPRPD